MKRTPDLKLLKLSKQYYIYLCIVGFFTKHSDLSYVVPYLVSVLTMKKTGRLQKEVLFFSAA